MTKEKALKLYDDYLPQVLNVIQAFYNDLSKEDEDEEDFFGDFAIRKRLQEMRDDPLQKEHSKSITAETINALNEDEYVQTEILETIVEKIIEHSNNELDEDEAMSLLTQALNERALEEYTDKLPEFLYRGVGGEASVVDFEKEGFEGADELYNEKSSVSPTGKVVYVSSEPSVAASYARKDKFDRAGRLPTSYGDNIYRIRTQGLDPSFFKKDVDAEHTETLFGPQYRYNKPIHQEIIEITDSSGTKRTAPRIEKISYLSDALCKDVVAPPHIISAIATRF